MPEPSRAPPPAPATPPRPRRAFWWLLAFATILAIDLTIARARPQAVSYSVFEGELAKDNIATVTVEPEARLVRGRFRHPAAIAGRTDSTFRVYLPYADPAPLVARLQERGVPVEASSSGGGWTSIILTLLPWLLIGGVWFFLLRQARAGGAQALAFGRARGGALKAEAPKVTFADVADVQEAKAELQEIIAFLREPARFQQLGGHLPKGVLLVGAPGTGKTLLARATAGEAGRPFFAISGSDFVELFVGVGASRVRDLFAQGKANAPCIIFIDELDAVGRTRGVSVVGGAHEEREQTLNQLLVEMDGFTPNEGIIVISATNRPDVLDPALLRPGRFDRRIVVDLPDVKGRQQILAMHARKVLLAPAVDLAAVARGTPGLSGADLANLINEAALLAARRQKPQVDQQDLEDAKDKVTLGIERRSLVLTEAERRLTAYHEAGHALVNLRIPGLDPVYKVTIVPRGQALGVTYALPEEDRHSHTREYLLGRLAVAQGGRVAEELVFGPEKVTTGAAQDFAQATSLARQMVTRFGMTEALGPMAVTEPAGFLAIPGQEPWRRAEVSEHTAELVDQEIRRLLTEATDRARTILRDETGTLHAIAEALLERETLDRGQLAALTGSG